MCADLKSRLFASPKWLRNVPTHRVDFSHPQRGLSSPLELTAHSQIWLLLTWVCQLPKFSLPNPPPPQVDFSHLQNGLFSPAELNLLTHSWLCSPTGLTVPSPQSCLSHLQNGLCPPTELTLLTGRGDLVHPQSWLCHLQSGLCPPTEWTLPIHRIGFAHPQSWLLTHRVDCGQPQSWLCHPLSGLCPPTELTLPIHRIDFAHWQSWLCSPTELTVANPRIEFATHWVDFAHSQTWLCSLAEMTWLSHRVDWPTPKLTLPPTKWTLPTHRIDFAYPQNWLCSLIEMTWLSHRVDRGQPQSWLCHPPSWLCPPTELTLLTHRVDFADPPWVEFATPQLTSHQQSVRCSPIGTRWRKERLTSWVTAQPCHLLSLCQTFSLLFVCAFRADKNVLMFSILWVVFSDTCRPKTGTCCSACVVFRSITSFSCGLSFFFFFFLQGVTCGQLLHQQWFLCSVVLAANIFSWKLPWCQGRLSALGFSLVTEMGAYFGAWLTVIPCNADGVWLFDITAWLNLLICLLFKLSLDFSTMCAQCVLSKGKFLYPWYGQINFLCLMDCCFP